MASTCLTCLTHFAGEPIDSTARQPVSHVDVLNVGGEVGIGHGIVEKLLRKHGLVRNVVVSVPSLATAAFTAACTDYVACLPRRITRAMCGILPLRLLKLPAPGVHMSLHMFWHSRTDTDPNVQFLRELIVATMTSQK